MPHDNTNRGALWVVKDPKSDRHPNMTGSINIDGTEYYLSGWATRTPEGRRPNITLTVKPKDERQRDAQPPADFDDDIPPF